MGGVMATETKKSSTGEMRRRHEAIIRSGALARLGSEGRLVFGVALCWASYRTCEFRMSVRGAATVCGVHPTTIRRGLSQLVAEGVVQTGPTEAGKRQIYRFNPAFGGDATCPPGARVVTAPRAQVVRATATPRARSGDEACAHGAQGVSGARTSRAPYSSIALNGSSRTVEADSPSGLPAVAEAGLEIA